MRQSNDLLFAFGYSFCHSVSEDLRVNTLLAPRLLSSRYIWSAVGAVLLKVVIVLMLTNCFSIADTSPAVDQTFIGVGGSLLEEAARYSYDFSKQCVRQTKEASLLLAPDFFLSLLQQCFNRPSPPLALASLLVVFFFPRKLLSVLPSADDDPLLSSLSISCV